MEMDTGNYFIRKVGCVTAEGLVKFAHGNLGFPVPFSFYVTTKGNNPNSKQVAGCAPFHTESNNKESC